jgi:hypothetical protein
MADPSLFIRWGEFQAGASGHLAILFLFIIVLVMLWRWRGSG